MLIVMDLALLGCAAPRHRMHQETAGRAQGIKTVALMLPPLDYAEVSAGGVAEPRPDWAEEGRVNVLKAIEKRFGTGGIQLRPLQADPDETSEAAEVFALYQAVVASYFMHATGEGNNPNVFPEKLSRFDYSVGSLEGLLRDSGADALLMVKGVNRVATGGRTAVTALGTIAGIAVGVLTGVVLLPSGWEGASLNMGLADRSGTILWFNVEGSTGGDLRNPETADSMINSILSSCPVAKQ
ncbi:MAG: hypothetical protein ED859_15350 [Desulfuromonadales bacterium]|nr:MAG: hypothetical protein ED859_15350 [Desulfuromonadales bacterium]